ncbi:hypothetical protein ACFL1J_01655 [Pseudomonadota bacterium]
MNDHCICTIIAKNYISFARTLCDSFLENHPSGRCFALVTDETDGYIDPSAEKFEILSPAVLKIPNWPDFTFKYNITELATALKPYLLEHLLQKEGLDRILYLDPDILVLQQLTTLFKLLDDRDVVLTPHLDTDYPDDGYLPNDAFIMKSGIYNLGFIGVRNSSNSLNFLCWWQRKLYDRCVIDHAAGYFVDQKFIDYALPLFDGFKVVPDPGYNVAYWNLHSRSIGWSGSEWTCNGNALYFFHFSGFKLAAPDQISKHQTRYQMAALPDLHILFQSYISLLQGNGYVETSVWPYTFNTYRNGTRLLPKLKRLYLYFRREPLSDPFGKNNFSIIYAISPSIFHFMLKRGRELASKVFSSLFG